METGAKGKTTFTADETLSLAFKNGPQIYR